MTSPRREIEIFTDLPGWIGRRRELEKSGRSIGFVPTMGALHEGHASLLRASRRENDFSVLSIYVNPTQFDDKSDFAKYPVTLDNDRQLAAREGVDAILLPRYEQIYPDSYRYRVREAGFSETLCGAHRPGHFDGVLTVVMKLLNLVRPARAYFGEKDYQQMLLIRDMVKAFFLDCDIVSCPIVRESDGLAMSSRNARLSPAAREKVPLLRRILSHAGTSTTEAKSALEAGGFDVDYIEDVGRRRLAAVRIDGVRLIDNVER